MGYSASQNKTKKHMKPICKSLARNLIFCSSVRLFLFARYILLNLHIVMCSLARWFFVWVVSFFLSASFCTVSVSSKIQSFSFSFLEKSTIAVIRMVRFCWSASWLKLFAQNMPSRWRKVGDHSQHSTVTAYRTRNKRSRGISSWEHRCWSICLHIVNNALVRVVA